MTRKTPTSRIILYSAAGIFAFLLLSTLYDFLVGDISNSRIFTFQMALTGLMAIGSVVGFKKIYHLVREKL